MEFNQKKMWCNEVAEKAPEFLPKEEGAGLLEVTLEHGTFAYPKDLSGRTDS